MHVRFRRVYLLGLFLACWSLATPVSATEWLQFRGINGSGRAQGARQFPADIGPNSSVIWRVAVPAGHSSPVVTERRIFLTGVRDGQLLTFALDRSKGRPAWEAEAPHEKLEEIHSIGSYAQSTPASDGDMVVSFFGSAGLFAYDNNGIPLWKVPMGPFNNDFGAASSPIIAGDFVILNQDHDTGSFLAAFDKRTGKQVWRTDRSEFPRNFSTPVLWDNGGRTQIVIAGTLRVIGYELATGNEAWTVSGLSRTVCATPVVGLDGNLYVAGWSAGGEAGDRIRVDAFESIIGQVDKDNDGMISEDELDGGAIKQRFSQVDRDNDNKLSREEYEFFRGLFDKSQNVVLAIRPGAAGDASESHVIWRQEKQVPFCASPLWENDHLFVVRDGGIFASIDARSGKIVKQGRLPATDEYYSSPVTGDKKIYLLNEKGKLTVVSAQGAWQVLASADFNDPVYATPALVDGRIYLRTEHWLYCFGN
ncbi:MAG: pyrrolo-quinoline quinone [Planctomycetes bacterium]|nr:pyrrolo-quinoline quinone [Planctomycetota bacterium]